MKVRYYIDPQTDEPHIYVPDSELNSLFVTAYDLRGKPAFAYRRRRRRIRP
jgi:hypothetical protein